jgi:outer membrane cobalamin receptor
VRFLLITLLSLEACPPAFAATPDDFEFFGYEKLTLEEAVNMKTGVATRSLVSARETPGVVTIVARDEIQNSGARSLVDVLHLVPGIEIGLDVQGNIGVISRGIWGNEGRVLVILDGQEYNDLGYGNLAIDRFSADSIERIEIIRGPGSVLYGGSAELAVINIISRRTGGAAAGRAAATYGRTARGEARKNLDLFYGLEQGKLKLSASAFVSHAVRSDKGYTDFAGNGYEMQDASALKSKNLNVGVEHGGFKGRVIIDEYKTTERDHFGVNLERPVRLEYSNHFAEAAYEFKLGESLTLTPKFNLNTQKPWNERDEFFFYDKKISRYREGLQARYVPREGVDILAGMEFQQDRAKVSDDTPAADFFPGGSMHAAYDNRAFYTQGQFDLPLGRLVLGARYEHHSVYQDAVVPRAAWTKAWERWHLKLLYSEAFRSPVIENIRLNTSIQPEKLSVFELESGYEAAQNLYVSATVFEMAIRKPIVYYADPVTSAEYYINSDPTGSRGVELLGRYKQGPHYADVSYSFYSATRNRAALYAVPGHSDALLGAPMHKAAFNVCVSPAKDWTVDPSGAWLAGRYGYYGADAAGSGLSRAFDNVLLMNLYVQKKDVFGRRGLSAGAGIFDLFNSNYAYIQTYDSGHAPLPSLSREYVAKLSYEF